MGSSLHKCIAAQRVNGKGCPDRRRILCLTFKKRSEGHCCQELQLSTRCGTVPIPVLCQAAASFRRGTYMLCCGGCCASGMVTSIRWLSRASDCGPGLGTCSISAVDSVSIRDSNGACKPWYMPVSKQRVTAPSGKQTNLASKFNFRLRQSSACASCN